MTNVEQCAFEVSKEPKRLNNLKTLSRQKIEIPSDDMWDAFIDMAKHIEIRIGDDMIGYSCINESNHILDFYIIKTFEHLSLAIFSNLLTNFDIRCGIVGTHHQFYYSVAMNFQKKSRLHYHLFRNHNPIHISFDAKVEVEEIEQKNLDEMVTFCYETLGAPKEWLYIYIGELISRRSYFCVRQAHEILGVFEVRENSNYRGYANLGMIVSTSHRNKGAGTYLLSLAIDQAIARKLKPICGCDADNIGSKIAIERNGFRSLYGLYKMDF